jgi:hypothetical protein
LDSLRVLLCHHGNAILVCNPRVLHTCVTFK